MPKNQTDWVAVRFIAEEIEVHFEVPPVLEKKPDTPDGFTWRDDSFEVVETISRWFDYDRKGRFSKNMQPHNLRAAKRRGSWGVGRFYFRVMTKRGRFFDLYYDRASEEAGDRKGHWFLWREMKPASSDPE